MLIDYVLGQTSVVLRVKVRNSTTGLGLTALTSASTGLRIAATADNESTATAYTSGGSTIDTITTLGTYAAPSSGHCRFKELDSTSHPGIYEIQFENTRLAVASAKSLLVTLSGVASMAETDAVIPLRKLDPYDSQRAGLAALPSSGVLTVSTAQTGDCYPSINAQNAYKISSSVNDVSPAAGSFKGAAGLSATNNFYVGQVVCFTSGTLAGIKAFCTAYTGSTKLLTFATAFPVAPANSDTFDII